MRDKRSGRVVCISLIIIFFIVWMFQIRFYTVKRDTNQVRAEEEQGDNKAADSENDTVSAEGTALKDDCFYLKNVNGFIVVYQSDKVTPYEYTSIECEMLPLRIQNEVKNGMYIENIRELYSFLENYSS